MLLPQYLEGYPFRPAPFSPWTKRLAIHHRLPGPKYQPGHKVWLCTKDITQKTNYKQRSPHYIGPYDIICIVNSSVIKLILSGSLRINPTFHVSQLKPVSVSPLCSTAKESKALPTFKGTLCHWYIDDTWITVKTQEVSQHIKSMENKRGHQRRGYYSCTVLCSWRMPGVSSSRFSGNFPTQTSTYRQRYTVIKYVAGVSEKIIFSKYKKP